MEIQVALYVHDLENQVPLKKMFLTQSRCQTKLFPPILAYLRADLDYFKTKAQPSFSIFSKKKRTEKKISVEDLKETAQEMSDNVKFFSQPDVKKLQGKREKNKTFKNSFWHYFENSSRNTFWFCFCNVSQCGSGMHTRSTGP